MIFLDRHQSSPFDSIGDLRKWQENKAAELGYDRKTPAPKMKFDTHGQPAFFNGKNYITPDVDGHNTTNGWKMFTKSGERTGTWDTDLNNRIKD